MLKSAVAPHLPEHPRRGGQLHLHGRSISTSPRPPSASTCSGSKRKLGPLPHPPPAPDRTHRGRALLDHCAEVAAADLRLQQSLTTTTPPGRDQPHHPGSIGLAPLPPACSSLQQQHPGLSIRHRSAPIRTCSPWPCSTTSSNSASSPPPQRPAPRRQLLRRRTTELIARRRPPAPGPSSTPSASTTDGHAPHNRLLSPAATPAPGICSLRFRLHSTRSPHPETRRPRPRFTVLPLRPTNLRTAGCDSGGGRGRR